MTAVLPPPRISAGLLLPRRLTRVEDDEPLHALRGFPGRACG
ncbi:hypothetical protein [Streptomyces sp. KMM 9044]